MTPALHVWRSEEFEDGIDSVMRAYGFSFGASEDVVDRQRMISLRHATYPNFACAVALDTSSKESGGGELAGFCYGSSMKEDAFWHKNVAPAFEEVGVAEWLHDYFGVGELAVLERWRNQGIGRALLNLLLQTEEASSHRRVLVMTDMHNSVRRLYESLGFRDVITDFRFAPTVTPKRIMGLAR